MRLPKTCLLLLLCAPALPAAPTVCRVEPTTYAGWEALQMSNAWVKLAIVPRLGGRLMQVTFGGHEYLFVNEQLKGQYLPPDPKRWFNYGGDKIWPMPEGSDDERHWAGAAGQPLDSGAFAAQIVAQGETCTVRLTSPPDPQIGQQYIREISIGTDSPAIAFHAVMKNVSGYPQEWSEQSVSQYNTANSKEPTQPNPDFWAFVPANPQSAFLNGYHVRTGSASTPGYAVRDGLFSVHTANAGGEVWIDSTDGWLAVVDGASQFTMVERFPYHRNAEYPGRSTAIFFTTGGRSASRPSNLYLEAEINSPMVRLDPGETYTMDTWWYPTRMGSDLKNATYAGVVGKPLAAASTPNGLTLSGEFGVFFAGQLDARFYDRRGMRLGAAPVQQVSPLELIVLQQSVTAPEDTFRVSLHLLDEHGLDRGPLGEAFVGQP